MQPNAPHHLSILSHAPAAQVKAFAEALIPELEPITVLENRTGLVMVPFSDTAQGATFYLGEVLVSEAQVRIASGAVGYGACLGRDLEWGMALALIDAALTAEIQAERIAAFIQSQFAQQAAADHEMLRAVESTRAELETF